MAILVTADLHLSANPRDEYRHTFMKRLRGIIRQEEAEAIIISGDLTEQKDHHSAELVNQIVDHFYKLATLCPVIFLRGNHDYASDPDCPFFRFLGRLEGVVWVNAPTPAKSIPVLAQAGYERCILLPHTADYKRDWADLLDGGFAQYDVAICHNTFEGAVGDNNQFLRGIPTDDIPEHVKIISGDVHKPQSFGNVTYVGAPYLVDFGDDYDPRVMLLHPNGATEAIPVEGPQKRLVEIRSVADLKKVRSVNPGDILKVRVALGRSDHAEWAAIRDKVREWGDSHELNIHLVQAKVLNDDRASSRSRKEASLTDEELLKKYCKVMGVDAATEKAGLKILRSA